MRIYKGVVEDNNDPKKIGRVKVRIFGVHSEFNENSDKSNNIGTKYLPWAEVMGDNQFGLISGVGKSSILRKGTWVWVILQDDIPEKPLVLGTMYGTNTKKTKYSSGDGFCDPDNIYPLDSRVGYSDMHPLSQSRYTTLATLETASGHLIELDDTPGDERIKVTHKTGSYFLIDKEGNIIVNGVKNMQYDIVGNMTVNVGGNSTWTTSGNTNILASRIDLN